MCHFTNIYNNIERLNKGFDTVSKKNKTHALILTGVILYIIDNEMKKHITEKELKTLRNEIKELKNQKGE